MLPSGDRLYFAPLDDPTDNLVLDVAKRALIKRQNEMEFMDEAFPLEEGELLRMLQNALNGRGCSVRLTPQQANFALEAINNTSILGELEMDDYESVHTALPQIENFAKQPKIDD